MSGAAIGTGAGAGIGAGIGAFIPGIGPVLGAGIGAALGGGAGSLLGGGGGGSPKVVLPGTNSLFLGNLFGSPIRMSDTAGAPVFSDDLWNTEAFQKTLRLDPSGDAAARAARDAGLSSIPLFNLDTSQAINDYVINRIPLSPTARGALAYLGFDEIPATGLAGSGVNTDGRGRVTEEISEDQLPSVFADPFDRTREGLSEISDASVSTLLDFLETGRKTDIDAIKDAAVLRYREDFLPEVLERMNPASNPTGFENIVNREIERLNVELGELDFQATEAATNRSLQALASGVPTTSNQLLTEASFPAAFLMDLLNLDASGRQQIEGTRAGGSLLEAFLALSGLPQAAPITQGVNPESTAGAIATILAENIPAIISALPSPTPTTPNTPTPAPNLPTTVLT